MLIEYGAAIECEGAGAEPDGVDVGRRGASSGRGESADRCARRSQGPQQEGFTALHFAARRRRPGDGPVVARRGRGREHPVGRRSPAKGPLRRTPNGGSSRDVWLSGGRKTAADRWLHSAAGRDRERPGCRSRSSCSITARTPTSAMRASRRCTGRRRTWESCTSNPVYGFEDPMSGIPDRQAKLRLVKALLAHGANPNARMTKPQPPCRRRIRRTRSARRLSCSPARSTMSR